MRTREQLKEISKLVKSMLADAWLIALIEKEIRRRMENKNAN